MREINITKLYYIAVISIVCYTVLMHRVSNNRLLYKSPGGGEVSKIYNNRQPEEARNLAAAKILSDKLGWHIILQYNNPRKKSADAYIVETGDMWEIKTITVSTISAIDSAVKNAKGQSHNVILHLLNDISPKVAKCAALHRMERSKYVNRVMIITKEQNIIDVHK